MTLGNLFIMMILAALGAWWWRVHGIRERALVLARQHCTRQGVELLDDVVALRRMRVRRVPRGLWCIAREYAFDFTVTGQDRYSGSLTMLGQRPGPVQLDAFRFQAEPQEAASAIDVPSGSSAAPQPQVVPQSQPALPAPRKAEVVRLDEWRRNHPRHKAGD
ncbi:MAG: hypothetical protein GAK43_02349 [Stenotrophomonas maltophilia]|nr:MAG: hypothetical protein GAK43_02349 [Stenotrophomonas maltophilia]